jgi:hypothetical protein
METEHWIVPQDRHENLQGFGIIIMRTIHEWQLHDEIETWKRQEICRPKVLYLQGGVQTSVFVSGSDVPGEAETKMAACAWQLLAGTAHDRLLLVGEDADLLLIAACAPAPQRMQVSVLPRLPQVTESDEDWTHANLVCQAPGESVSGDVALIALLEAGNDYLPAVRGLQLGTLWKVYGVYRQTNLNKASMPSSLLNESGDISVCELVKLLRLMDQDLQGPGVLQQKSATKEFLWAPGGHKKMFEVQNYLQVNHLACTRSQVLHAVFGSRFSVFHA